MSKLGRSDGRFHDALTSRANVPFERPDHFSRDVGRAVVRADLGDNVPKKVLRNIRWQLITSLKNTAWPIYDYVLIGMALTVKHICIVTHNMTRI